MSKFVSKLCQVCVEVCVKFVSSLCQVCVEVVPGEGTWARTWATTRKGERFGLSGIGLCLLDALIDTIVGFFLYIAPN